MGVINKKQLCPNWFQVARAFTWRFISFKLLPNQFQTYFRTIWNFLVAFTWQPSRLEAVSNRFESLMWTQAVRNPNIALNIIDVIICKCKPTQKIGEGSQYRFLYFMWRQEKFFHTYFYQATINLSLPSAKTFRLYCIFFW